ncbi:MAG TPA: FecR family protein [Nitrospirales bacterium]|nr:FecR family protein [Nitrospirales bacterium]
MSDADCPDSEQERLEAEAVTWMVRLTSGETTDADRRAANLWCRKSVAHQRAMEKAFRIWNGMEGLRDSLIIPDRSGEVRGQTQRTIRHPLFPSAYFYRQDWWVWKVIVAAIAVLALSYTFQSDFLIDWRADYSTGTGEQATWEFIDGSIVQLNTHTALNIAYSQNMRRVDLLQGEAAFRVAKDPSRPFIVQADQGTIRAVGTEFFVYKLDRSVLVTVVEGVVDVSVPLGHERPSSSARLKSGQSVQFGTNSGLSEVKDVDLGIATAWQRGRLIFEAAPLTEVVEEINRYRSGHIVIVNDTLREHLVSGVFDLDSLDSAVTTIERTLPVASLHLTDRLIVLQ